jgi:hypothetical protein
VGLKQFQGMRWKLADMWREIEAARAFSIAPRALLTNGKEIGFRFAPGEERPGIGTLVALELDDDGRQEVSRHVFPVMFPCWMPI